MAGSGGRDKGRQRFYMAPMLQTRTAAPALDWDALDALKFTPERDILRDLLAARPLDGAARQRVRAEAIKLVRASRATKRGKGTVEAFLQQFSLGTSEGLALMCLAEALLRTPDADTRDRLIAERISSADWDKHAGRSDSMFVNVSTWGLMLTGKIVDVAPEARRDFAGYLRGMVQRVGEPVIRQAVVAAVRMMGEQFVLAPTIDGAIARARKEGVMCSFDMLGEGARTRADAARYEQLYADAIERVGAAREAGATPETGNGCSVKLSALYPRYEATHEADVLEHLYPRLLRLAVIAASHDLNFAIDAEEADRLALSLKLLDRLARDPALGDWEGLGVVVQAYSKRAPALIERLGELSRGASRRIMVRLVKGAYWDSEIKRSQVNGHPDYPVFTTKPATDLCYLHCARLLIGQAPALYPQFATHNAHTLAAVREMAAEAGVVIEHQRLHGMGEALYAAAAERWGDYRLRAYAPVGGHEDLLPYLVRRLLENGANSSFVHALLDPMVPPEKVVNDPIGEVEAWPDKHPRIPLPQDIYGEARPNSLGRDLSQRAVREGFARAVATADARRYEARAEGTRSTGAPVTSPADRSRVLGHVFDADEAAVDRAVAAARTAQPGWDKLGGRGRAAILRRMGDALEAELEPLVALLAREAGKTLPDGVAEVREAADFCRYYAHLAETQFGGPLVLGGPAGETNHYELGGRGVFACISPWNFPLAIFTGQLTAALASGNAVCAKPAEQTPLVAAEAVRLFRAAGLPAGVLHLIPGPGELVGAALVKHPGINGVSLTGGTDTARAINRALALRDGPIIPFIAETGGLNAMFVDTTALHEQVIDDALQSAFGSAGQRCSALRMLFLPAETAPALIERLAGAMECWRLGDPTDPATDLGPVIDDAALDGLRAHRARLEREAKVIRALDVDGLGAKGSYFAPVLAEVDRPDFLEREVFGPILHVYRYKRRELPQVARALAARGYGLTLGVHTRVDAFAREVREMVPAGNVYVNRSIIGAVVGVQPFGGEGLSGTGPKAGGPYSLLRYATERAISVNITAQGGDPQLMNLEHGMEVG